MAAQVRTDLNIHCFHPDIKMDIVLPAYLLESIHNHNKSDQIEFNIKKGANLLLQKSIKLIPEATCFELPNENRKFRIVYSYNNKTIYNIQDFCSATRSAFQNNIANGQKYSWWVEEMDEAESKNVWFDPSLPKRLDNLRF